MKDVPDKVFELLDFQLPGPRSVSRGAGLPGRGYVVPDGNWKPTEGQEPRIAPEAPTGFFRLELRLEENGRAHPPAGQELVEVRDQMEAVGLPNCAVTPSTAGYPSGSVGHAGAAGYPELPGTAADRTGGPGTADAGQVQRRCWRVSPTSLEDAMALTEQLDAYNRMGTASQRTWPAGSCAAPWGERMPTCYAGT